jgi:O-antigen/teichoic acid export membrane protein
MALLSENIASVFLGSSFSAQAASLIPIVAAGVLISGVKAFYFDVAFLLGKRTRDLIAIAGIAAIANILLNVLWIPANGILGAAYASAVSYAIGLGFSVAWGSKVFYLDRWDSELAKVVGATICLAVYLLLVATYRGPLALLGQVALGSLLYGGVLALLRYKAFRGQHLISQ